MKLLNKVRVETYFSVFYIPSIVYNNIDEKMAESYEMYELLWV